MSPRENARYTATARFADGSTRDITSEAQWTSTDESILPVAAPGIVEGRTNGEAEVRAVFANRSHGHQVVVVPEGQYVLRASVYHGQPPISPIFTPG